MELNQFIEDVTPLRAVGIKVTQNEETVAYHLWEPMIKRNIYSASKSFTSAAMGFAVQEGLIHLDEKLVDAFSEELPELVSENLQMATVRDLLTMHLGQSTPFLMGTDRQQLRSGDWVRAALQQPFDEKPGSHFVYNNSGPYLAGILVQRRAGCDLVSYLTPRLFQPLGIQCVMWEPDPMGYTFGAGGLFLTMEELHRFGLLYLQDGLWEGKQLLSRHWIRESTRIQGDNGRDEYGYGYLFWGSPDGAFRAQGKFGQFTIICRKKNAVITVIAESRDVWKLQEIIFQDIYSQL